MRTRALTRLFPAMFAAAFAFGGLPGCDGHSPATVSGGDATGTDTTEELDTASTTDTGQTDAVVGADGIVSDDIAMIEDTAAVDSAGTADTAGAADTQTSADTSTDTTPGGLTTVKSSLTRDMTPNVAAADKEILVAGNTAFALDLYHQLGAEPGNLFFSPASISVALAMTYAGTAGDTAAQLASTMHFDLAPAALHPAFDWLDLELNSRGEGAQGADGEQFRLHVVNAIWGQTGYGFLDGFLDTLAQSYGAGMTLLDFEADVEAARVAINAWVAEMTEDRIPELIPAGLITSETRLVLTNAIYFNAAWKSKFDEENTTDGQFHRLDGSTADVKLMTQAEMFPIAEGADYLAVELPYDGEELSMIIVQPSSFETFEQGLTPAVLDGILGSLQTDSIALTMPRFELSTEALLADTLKAMGMTDAFDYGTADFSPMDGSHELFVSQVIHKAFVKVNEAGTEAADATAVVVVGGGLPKQVRIDHPFLFLIRDLKTGTVLFLGRVVDPSA